MKKYKIILFLCLYFALLQFTYVKTNSDINNEYNKIKNECKYFDGIIVNKYKSREQTTTQQKYFEIYIPEQNENTILAVTDAEYSKYNIEDIYNVYKYNNEYSRTIDELAKKTNKNNLWSTIFIFLYIPFMFGIPIFIVFLLFIILIFVYTIINKKKGI